MGFDWLLRLGQSVSATPAQQLRLGCGSESAQCTWSH